MLSPETSVGDHPALVAKTMRHICREVEFSEDYKQVPHDAPGRRP